MGPLRASPAAAAPIEAADQRPEAAAVARARDASPVVVMVLLAGAYFVLAKLGLSLAIVHSSATAVWPPTGIALAALMLFGYRIWPGIFVGAFLANVTTPGTVATSIGIATGNTLEGLVGAYLVNRFANGLNTFERAQDTFRFAFLAGMLATTVSATFGIASLVISGLAPEDASGPIWITWWLGDMGGALVVTPLLILWSERSRFRWTRARLVEGATVLVALLAVGQVVFGWLVPNGLRGYPLAFICVPPLVWLAYRFDRRAAATGLFLLSVIAIRGLVAGTSDADRGSLNSALLVLQLFMATAAVTTLALAAVVAERERMETAVRAASEELRQKVVELEAFNHAMSHDLRSPIGAILNYAAILEEDCREQIDEDSLRILRRIQVSAQSTAQMLQQLVSFSWVEREADGGPKVDMTFLARQAYAEVTAGAEDVSGVIFELQDLPPTRGNPALLSRVFRNLISNAVKFTRGQEERRVVVMGRIGRLENAYCVSDNGIGFDPEMRGALFQPFRRLNSQKDFEGSGLGLAIVAKIIRKHHGRVWADSDGSKGAQFWFTLPQAEGHHE